MSRISERYTLVQHTGYSVTDHADLERGVETRGGITAPIAKKIIAAGGVVYDDYTEATNREESENYPPGVQGLIPQVKGTFIHLADLGEAIYIPAGAHV